MTVSGTIVFDGASAAPTEFSRYQPRLAAVDRAATVQVSNGTSAPLVDRAFKIEGVVPGSYRLTAVGATSGGGNVPWAVKSIVRSGKDLLDTPIEIHPGEDIGEVVVTYTDRRTELGGTLVDAAGHPASQYTILAFSSDHAHGDEVLLPRWSATARAGVDGSFTITGLPPGEYDVCALTALDPSQKSDAAFLETLAGASFTITLADGGRVSQTFRIGSR
jgi:hypothetical protein